MTDIKNADLPASSTNLAIDEYEGTINCGINKPLTGLTKREAFAMAAMQGLLANSEPTSWSDSQYYDQMSKQAVNHADKLLAELSK